LPIGISGDFVLLLGPPQPARQNPSSQFHSHVLNLKSSVDEC
jgi:hypothetical protein